MNLEEKFHLGINKYGVTDVKKFYYQDVKEAVQNLKDIICTCNSNNPFECTVCKSIRTVFGDFENKQRSDK